MAMVRILAFGLGCLVALSVRAATVQVENIRTWPAPDHSRIVLDIDRPAEYTVFVLRDPDRVVIDLSDGKLLKRVPKARSGDRLLASIRAAHRKRSERRGRDGSRNFLRVVLDMKKRVRPKSFLLKPNQKYGHRLVIDVYPTDAASSPKTVKEARDDAAGRPTRRGGRDRCRPRR